MKNNGHAYFAVLIIFNSLAFNVLLGVSFDTSLMDLISQISVAMKVFVHGVEAYVSDPANKDRSVNDLVPRLSCAGASDQDNGTESKWTFGETFHR